MTRIFKTFENNCKFYWNFAKILDINIFRSNSLSPETNHYPNFQNIKKCKIFQKIAEMRHIKMLKTIQSKTMQQSIVKPWSILPAPWGWQNWKTDKN